jgi:hypothetical protein
LIPEFEEVPADQIHHVSDLAQKQAAHIWLREDSADVVLQLADFSFPFETTHLVVEDADVVEREPHG